MEAYCQYQYSARDYITYFVIARPGKLIAQVLVPHLISGPSNLPQKSDHPINAMHTLLSGWWLKSNLEPFDYKSITLPERPTSKD